MTRSDASCFTVAELQVSLQTRRRCLPKIDHRPLFLLLFRKSLLLKWNKTKIDMSFKVPRNRFRFFPQTLPENNRTDSRIISSTTALTSGSVSSSLLPGISMMWSTLEDSSSGLIFAFSARVTNSIFFCFSFFCFFWGVSESLTVIFVLGLVLGNFSPLLCFFGVGCEMKRQKKRRKKGHIISITETGFTAIISDKSCFRTWPRSCPR